MILPDPQDPGPLVEIPHLWIPLPDGTRLSARLWRPEAGAHPAIAEALPYRHRDGTADRDALTHPWLAARGYACVRIDLRGTGDSDGRLTDEYDETELADVEAALAWIAAQPWCDGRTGLMGISWGGFNALQVAMRRPPSLGAVVTLASSTDRFADDVHYKGGALLGANAWWGAQMISYQSRPPDPAIRDDWRAEWLGRLADMPLIPARWHREQARGAYWRHGSVCEDWDAIEVPVLAVAGWADGYRNTPGALVRHLPGAAAIVGPWIHKYPHFAAPEPRIGFLQEALRWWDRWLKDRPAAEPDPRMRAYVEHHAPPARWRDAQPGQWGAWDAWPGGAPWTMGLTPRGLGGAPEPVERRIDTPPEAGAAMGAYTPFAFGPEGPGDQAPDDARAACFDTEALARPFGLVGRPRLSLRLVPHARMGRILARLCDVAPDGSSLLIGLGVANLGHHPDPAAPRDLVPDAPLDLTLDLDEMARIVPAGHRLRLALSTASWPFLWPLPMRTPVTVRGGSLSVRMLRGPFTEWVPPLPVGAPPRATETLRAAGYVREERIEDGARITAITVDGGALRDAGHGLEQGEASHERWSIRPGDPLSAAATFDWRQARGRGDWQVETRAVTTMRGDAEALYLACTLTATEKGDRVFERTLTEAIPRRFV